MREPHLDVGKRAEHLVYQRCELVLLTVQPVGIRRLVLQQLGQFENGNYPIGAIAKLPARYNNAQLVQLCRNPEWLEYLKSRRVERSGPQVHEQFGVGLKHQHGYITRGQAKRRNETDGTASDDDHPIVLCSQHSLPCRFERRPDHGVSRAYPDSAVEYSLQASLPPVGPESLECRGWIPALPTG
jgi:hypothetical protein